MAKFVKKKSTEPRYVLEFTASEMKLLADVFGDLGEERIVLDYSEDGDRVKPTKASHKKILAIASAIDETDTFHVLDDYFDRWEKVSK